MTRRLLARADGDRSSASGGPSGRGARSEGVVSGRTDRGVRDSDLLRMRRQADSDREGARVHTRNDKRSGQSPRDGIDRIQTCRWRALHVGLGISMHAGCSCLQDRSGRSATSRPAYPWRSSATRRSPPSPPPSYSPPDARSTDVALVARPIDRSTWRRTSD